MTLALKNQLKINVTKISSIAYHSKQKLTFDVVQISQANARTNEKFCT